MLPLTLNGFAGGSPADCEPGSEPSSGDRKTAWPQPASKVTARTAATAPRACFSMMVSWLRFARRSERCRDVPEICLRIHIPVRLLTLGQDDVVVLERL